MKKIIVFFCFLYLSHANLFSQREKYNFNSDWKLFVGDDSLAATPQYNDANWKTITLPRAWNEDDAFKVDIANLSTGIAWYRKHFKIPKNIEGQKIFIEFEGVRQAAAIYVNGNYIGLHENGITAFGFDISPFIKYDNSENIIAVRTDNSWDYREKATNTKYQWLDKNFNTQYGGITKNVLLHITAPIYQTLPLYHNLQTTGTYVYASNIDISKKMATINASSQIKNETAVEQNILYQVVVKDINKKVVATFASLPYQIKSGATTTVSAKAIINNLNFWSWGYGYLYNVETALIINGKTIDKVITTTGFRKTDFKNGMVYLNNRVIQIKGYAQRSSNEWPAIGISVPAWLSDYSNKLILESNANTVRWMHITPWKQDIESFDRMGLMQAMPAGDAEKDVEGVRWEQRKAVMKDAIIYNRNNPSIIFYECGNESISEQHMKEMKNIRNEFDAYGGRAIGSREMLDSKEAEYGGEMLYINKSATFPVWAMEYSRDEGLRKYWDDYTPPYHKDGDGPLHKGQSAKEYNRNQESHAIENIVRWYDFWKERPGTGNRVSSGGVNIIFSETNTHHRGAENFRRSGEVDALRIKKENFYAHQIMWNGWVEVEKPGIHIIGHWNYDSSVTKPVYVISSADKVELKVNGKSYGFGKQSARFLYTFSNVKWQPGTITAIGYNSNNAIITTHKIETAGKPFALKLTAITHPKGLQANGHDLALIEVEVIDKNGKRCPTAMNMISFTLQGQAEWRGGMAQGPDNFILAKTLPVECGVNRVLIRSTTIAGNITLQATSTNLQAAQININSVPVTLTNGLSNQLPSYGLNSNLEKGPTPLTPSYITSRNTLKVIKVKAGANSDSALKSIDDNELTDWYNDGKLQTAWIEYELDKPSVINEISLKLNNFRSKVYPLLITVDGQIAFNDTTQKTLGYFTAICKPIKGKFIRIQLATLNSTKAEEQITEVSGKKLDDGVSRNDATAKGTLSIIEAEFYETIKK